MNAEQTDCVSIVPLNYYELPTVNGYPNVSQIATVIYFAAGYKFLGTIRVALKFNFIVAWKCSYVLRNSVTRLFTGFFTRYPISSNEAAS